MTLADLSRARVVSVIRAPQTEFLLPACEALYAGGIRAFEVTTSTPNAIEGIGLLRKSLPSDAYVGIGTVLDVTTAEAAVGVGAQFVVSPVFLPEVVRRVKEFGVLVAPGCLTPTEVFAAWNEGADLVKIFPATTFGPGYLKDLLAPMPFLKLMPTGGVEASNVGDWIKAGAVAVGAGSSLLPKAVFESQKWEVLVPIAKAFMA